MNNIMKRQFSIISIIIFIVLCFISSSPTHAQSVLTNMTQIMVSQSSWVNNTFANIHLQFSLPTINVDSDNNNEFQALFADVEYDMNDSLILDMDGIFQQHTIAFAYVTVQGGNSTSCLYNGATPDCNQDRMYPGVVYELNISANVGDSNIATWTSTSFSLRRALLPWINMYQKLENNILPNSIYIDLVIPLEHYIPRSIVDHYSLRYSTSFATIDPDYINRLYGFNATFTNSRVNTGSGIMDQVDLRLTTFQRADTILAGTNFKFDLLTPSKGYFKSTGDDMNIAIKIIPLWSFNLMKYGSSSSKKCTFSTSSKIDSFFWTFESRSNTISIDQGPFDDFPQRITMDCPQSIAYISPSYHYVFSQDTIYYRQISAPALKSSYWPLLNDAVLYDANIIIPTPNEEISNDDGDDDNNDNEMNIQQTTENFTTFLRSTLLDSKKVASISSLEGRNTRSSGTSYSKLEFSTRLGAGNTGKTDTSDSTTKSLASVGKIIGIAVGIFFGIIALIVICIIICAVCGYCCWASSRKKDSSTPQPQAVETVTYTTTTVQPQPMYLQQQPQPMYVQPQQGYPQQDYSQQYSGMQPQQQPYPQQGYPPQQQQPYPPQQQQPYPQQQQQPYPQQQQQYPPQQQYSPQSQEQQNQPYVEKGIDQSPPPYQG